MTNPTKTRRRFTAQQKQEAIELCLQEGISCNAVAQRLRDDVVPLAERLIAGQQQGPAFVAVHHQLKKHRGLRLVLADVANVVNDQQGVAIKLGERLGQGLVRLGPLQRLHQGGA